MTRDTCVTLHIDRPYGDTLVQIPVYVEASVETYTGEITIYCVSDPSNELIELTEEEHITATELLYAQAVEDIEGYEDPTEEMTEEEYMRVSGEEPQCEPEYF